MRHGIKQDRLNRIMGVKRSSPMHVHGNKQSMYVNKHSVTPLPKESHDIYNHHSNSVHVEREPMFFGHHVKREKGLSHIEKPRPKSHRDHFM